MKRGTEQVVIIPYRTMICNDVQGFTSVAGAGRTGATDAGRLHQLIQAGTLKAEYIYNDNGQQTKKTLYQTNGITVASTTIYHYDQMGHLITETTETGNLIKDYVWSNQMMPVAQIDNSGGTESITYLYTDHLMTNRLATGQSKTIIWRWEGEAFGNTPAQELGTVSINLRFPGQYYDQETNLHYNWNRYYDPTLGRYITSDPVGLDGGMNTYSYAMQNPIYYTDPLGLAYSPPGEHGMPWPNGNKSNSTGEQTCEQKCDDFKSTCEFAAKFGPFATAVALELACLGTGISAPVCMISINVLQGLSTAYLLSECEKVTALCKEECKKNCPTD